MREYIAYRGSEFTIEWYYDVKGESQALKYFQQQSKEKQRNLLKLLRLMGDHGKIFDETKFRNEGDKIYAFKPQPDRYLCFFFRGKKIILTNAFAKKTQKLPQGEKELYQSRKINAYFSCVKAADKSTIANGIVLMQYDAICDR